MHMSIIHDTGCKTLGKDTRYKVSRTQGHWDTKKQWSVNRGLEKIDNRLETRDEKLAPSYRPQVRKVEDIKYRTQGHKVTRTQDT